MEKFAIVVSQFNHAITTELLRGARARLIELNIINDNIKVVEVPGAIEIPLAAKLLAKTKKFDAIICLGAVIRGETSHYDYVCEQVSRGCQEVMMEYEMPVIFGVLTTENFAQAEARIGGRHGHKGIEAAEAALHMVKIVKTIKECDL